MQMQLDFLQVSAVYKPAYVNSFPTVYKLISRSFKVMFLM